MHLDKMKLHENTDLFDSVGEAGMVGSEWHLMNKSDIRVVKF